MYLQRLKPEVLRMATGVIIWRSGKILLLFFGGVMGQYVRVKIAVRQSLMMAGVMFVWCHLETKVDID